ncbi:hypothetical protein [Vibrio vulnificus]|uniref:hypothetical protein n=1 Tax=Vibrio vulnificus TaxID=672 RepID=UPI003D9C800E
MKEMDDTVKVNRDHMYDIEAILNKSARQSLLERFILVLTLLPLLFATILIFSQKQDVKPKELIQGKIIQLIQNDADLETIKHVFTNEPTISNNFIKKLFGKSIDGYPSNIPLSSVLMDLKSHSYMVEESVNLGFIKKVDDLIKDNEKKNPFDSLEQNQRDLFENISLKLGAQYEKIQPEVNKIADEIRLKNVQIKDSDSKSQIGYYVTILSFISALLIAAFQIFQGRAQKIKEIFVSAIEEIEKGKHT